MKRRTKLGISLAAIGVGVIGLSSCTASFCTPTDVARMKYAFEPGIVRLCPDETNSTVYEFKGSNFSYKITGVTFQVAKWEYEGEVPYIGKFVYQEFKDSSDNVIREKKELNYLNTIIKNVRDNGMKSVNGSITGTVEYLTRFDYLAFNAIFGRAADDAVETISLNYFNEDDRARIDHDLLFYSYLRFSDGGNGNTVNWDYFNSEAKKAVGSSSILNQFTTNTAELSPDVCPSSDYQRAYHSQLDGYIGAYRTCLTTKTDKYGVYGYEANGIYINSKTWGDAWSRGFFEGLLVYPIGWLIDSIVIGFHGTGISAGMSAFLGIVFVTFIIRALMLLATWKQTQSNAKMTELQPEIAKIQNKYPNSNTSKAEKARMAQDMQALYKKNHVNPFMTLIVMIIQFPVFICVWGALSGSAVLTNGTFLGLTLSTTIKDALFTGVYWTAAGGYAAVTALFLFLLMAAAQTVSMLLPQWIQKKKAKKIEKLGRNPAQKQQSNRMKWFTYIMLAVIIFMGFTLVSAMGIYWFIGAVFSIVQTLLIQWYTERKAKRK